MNDLFAFAFISLCLFFVVLGLYHRTQRLRRKRGQVLSDVMHEARRRESEFMNRQVLESYWERYLKDQLHDPQNKTQLTALVWFCRDYADYRERGYLLALRCVIKEGRDADWVRAAQILGKLYYETNASTDRHVFTDAQLNEDLSKQAVGDADSQ